LKYLAIYIESTYTCCLWYCFI